MLSRRCALLASAALPACSMGSLVAPDAAPGDGGAPPAPREFRGAWVATVDNIDWPSRRGLPAAEQQRELRAMLDRAAALGLNAIVLQVRPACDAVYASTLEPWSEVLSGTQGQAPGWDPLAMWVDEAHARGIELHAWFNPYRARHPSARGPQAAQHVANRRPAWVRAYADLLWLDPGEPEAMAHSLAVIADVATRYDIDGVHVDDYFYPYPEKVPGGQAELAFPDDASYARHGQGLARADWRRRNVDRFVQAMHERVRAIKPGVKVGISPFGLPRPDRRPAGIEGFSQYDKLHADVERWLAEGWLDYLAPQLYWALEPRAQAFGALLEAWARENVRGRHLWPGLFTSAVARPPRQWPADELLNQLALLRTQRARAGGFIHFSMVALMDDRGGLASRLLAARPEAALVPASPWLGAAAPAAPRLSRVSAAAPQVRVQAASPGEPARWLAIWVRRRGAWRLFVRPADVAITVPLAHAEGALEALVASAVSRSGVESARVSLAALNDH